MEDSVAGRRIVSLMDAPDDRVDRSLSTGGGAEGAAADVYWCHECETFLTADEATRAVTIPGYPPRLACPCCGEDWEYGVWMSWHARCDCGRPGGLQEHYGDVFQDPNGGHRAHCACGWSSRSYKGHGWASNRLTEHLQATSACGCNCHKIGTACADQHVGDRMYPGDCKHTTAAQAVLTGPA